MQDSYKFSSGKGLLERGQHTYGTKVDNSMCECPECYGGGRLGLFACKNCKGSGKVENSKECPTCKGQGNNAQGDKCDGCGGFGRVNSADLPEEKEKETGPFTENKKNESCADCEGTGESPKGGKCKSCDGTGLEMSS